MKKLGDSNTILDPDYVKPLGVRTLLKFPELNANETLICNVTYSLRTNQGNVMLVETEEDMNDLHGSYKMGAQLTWYIRSSEKFEHYHFEIPEDYKETNLNMKRR